MRALVVSNMQPDPRHPERGSFVRDQVSALRALEGLDVELFEFPPGASALAHAAVALRRDGAARYDVVHAHFGLTAWPALGVSADVHALTLHGTDLSHPRTRLLTRAVLPRLQLIATVSEQLLEQLPSDAARARAQVLPCGVDVERFRPLPRAEARERLGLAGERPYLLFPADPSRAEKRHDLASQLARELDTELLTLGGVDPAQVPLWVNSSNAVLVPSDREGFGLAVLEALACEVPVLATPVGVHPQALEGVERTLCAPFDPVAWRAALEPLLGVAEVRVAGRARAESYSTGRMAERVWEAWCAARDRAG